MPGERDDDGDVDDHYDEDDQCLCQGVPGEPDGKLPSQKWCQLARSQNLYDKDNDYSHQLCWIHFENCECQLLISTDNDNDIDPKDFTLAHAGMLVTKSVPVKARFALKISKYFNLRILFSGYLVLKVHQPLPKLIAFSLQQSL